MNFASGAHTPLHRRPGAFWVTSMRNHSAPVIILINETVDKIPSDREQDFG